MMKRLKYKEMSKIGIIIQREYSQRVRKKSFILTTILTPVLMLGLMAVVVWMMARDVTTEKTIQVIDNSGIVAAKLENTKSLTFTPTDKIFEELRQSREEGVFGYLVIGSDIVSRPNNLQLYSYEQSTIDIDEAITKQVKSIIEGEKLKAYDIENLDKILAEVQTRVSLSTYQINETTGEDKESSSGLTFIIATIFGFMIYMFIFLYGGMVMQGVIQEKTSKVLEIMVSSVKPFQLMFGKIVGIALVALTQLAIWAVLLTGAATVLSSYLAPEITPEMTEQMAMGMDMGQVMEHMDPESSAMLSMVSDAGYIFELMVMFTLFFIGGYLLYAAMFAAVGSAVDNEADTQQLQLPISMPLILGFIMMYSSIRDPNGGLAFWGSMIPFTSPIVMMARLPYGVPMWELLLSLALLYGTFVGMVWLAGKIYRVGIFMYGKKPSWKDLAKWVTYKD